MSKKLELVFKTEEGANKTITISNKNDAAILREYKDEFARAIARGITDYWQSTK